MHIDQLGPSRNPLGREPIGGAEGGSRENWSDHLVPLADRPVIIENAAPAHQQIMMEVFLVGLWHVFPAVVWLQRDQ